MNSNFSMHGAHKIHSLLSFPYFSKRVLITLWMNENNAHLCNLRAFLIGLFIVGVASRQFAFRWSKTNVHISIANKCFWSNVYFLNRSIYCKIVSQFSWILDWNVWYVLDWKFQNNILQPITTIRYVTKIRRWKPEIGDYAIREVICAFSGSGLLGSIFFNFRLATSATKWNRSHFFASNESLRSCRIFCVAIAADAISSMEYPKFMSL